MSVDEAFESMTQEGVFLVVLMTLASVFTVRIVWATWTDWRKFKRDEARRTEERLYELERQTRRDRLAYANETTGRVITARRRWKETRERLATLEAEVAELEDAVARLKEAR